MKYKKIVLASLLCSIVYFSPRDIFSDNIKQANQYYEKYDYKLALDIYQKIMLKKPSLEVAQKLANCYRFINDTEGAERAYARVLTFSGADAINYKFYADALKQNGKFDDAKKNYILYGQKLTSKADDANRLANSTDVARMWAENSDENVKISNEKALNSENSEFSPVRFKDNLVFTSDRWFIKSATEKKKAAVYGWTGNPYLKLYQATKKGQALDITLMPGSLNQEYHTGPAVFTASGDTVYFTVSEAPKGKKKKQPVISKKIYFSYKKGLDWTAPTAIALNNSAYSIQHPALSTNGAILYFASDKPGGFGGMDIYASQKQADGSWGSPVNCGQNVNSTEDDVFPVVRYDGRLYFASKGHIGMGGLDIFTAKGAYNEFEPADNLKSPVNSTKDDFGIFFADELNGYLASNRKGGNGMDDIYSFAITPVKPSATTASATPFYSIEGEVTDKTTGAPLSGVEVVLMNKTTNQQQTSVSDEQGKFRFELAPEMDYVVTGNENDYYSKQEGNISTMGLKESTVFNVKFELERSKDTYMVKLKNIYYNFNKWNIRKDASVELSKVVSFMNNMPNISIELRSHTDSRGKAIYNKWLSQKRAESAVGYLVNKGVGTSRLTAVGLGETELINRCSNGVKCSLAEHQMNRRTEFKVIKVNPIASISTTITASDAIKR